MTTHDSMCTWCFYAVLLNKIDFEFPLKLYVTLCKIHKDLYCLHNVYIGEIKLQDYCSNLAQIGKKVLSEKS